MGALILAHDWSATPLGPIRTWPQSLRTATAILLRSAVPIAMLWGEDGIMIYNDAYSAFADRRHPALLGTKVREGWPEVADFNDNVMKVGLAGGTLAYRDQELTLYRRGVAERVWMDLDYSPVLDESGEPAGVIAIVVETTEKVLAERRNAAERERLTQLFEQAPGFMAMLGGAEHVFEMANPAYMQLVGYREVIGKPVREALPEVEGQGFLELLDQVYRTGKAYVGSAAKVTLQRSRGGPAEERFVDFVYQPITDSHGKVLGIFIEGADVTERRRNEERRKLLVGELNHRVKNTLATVQAIAAQTFRGEAADPRARAAFEARLLALSQAHTLLTRENWEGVGLRDLAVQALEPFAGGAGAAARFAIEGDDVRLQPKAGLALNMAFHELATNAAKYGALSDEAGRVVLGWTLEPEANRIRLYWQESGGPPVEPPARKGFGSRLIERGLAQELGGTVRLDFARQGVVCEIEMPAREAEG